MWVLAPLSWYKPQQGNIMHGLPLCNNQQLLCAVGPTATWLKVAGRTCMAYNSMFRIVRVPGVAVITDISWCYDADLFLPATLPVVDAVLTVTCTTSTGSPLLQNGDYPLKLTADGWGECKGAATTFKSIGTSVVTLTSAASSVALAASTNTAVCPGAASLAFSFRYSGDNPLESAVQLRATLAGATCSVSSAGNTLGKAGGFHCIGRLRAPDDAPVSCALPGCSCVVLLNSMITTII